METIASKGNNCTLVAVKEVSRKPDEEIFKAFRKNGYRDNQGMYNTQWTKAAMDLGLQLEKVEVIARNTDNGYLTYARNTLNDFLRAHKKGTFLLSVRGHALAVRDGRVVDHNKRDGAGLRRGVMAAWRVINAPVVAVMATGKLMVRVPSYRAKQKGTASHDRYFLMAQYLHNNPEAKIQDIIKNTPYTKADYNHDLKRGLIAYV